MGYEIAMGPCVVCGNLFAFNAERVPSIEVQGAKRPICQSCVDEANPIREENGLPPIVPLPGAYEPEGTD